jgi:hypothetical protein
MYTKRFCGNGKLKIYNKTKKRFAGTGEWCSCAVSG